MLGVMALGPSSPHGRREQERGHGSGPIQSEGSRATLGWALTETVSGSARNGSTPGYVAEDGENSFIPRFLKPPLRAGGPAVWSSTHGPPLVRPSGTLAGEAPRAQRRQVRATAR